MKTFRLAIKDNQNGQCAVDLRKELRAVSLEGFSPLDNAFHNEQANVIALLRRYSGKAPSSFNEQRLAFIGETKAEVQRDGSEKKEVYSISEKNGSAFIHTGNNMGVLRLRDEHCGIQIILEIHSRFDSEKSQFFMTYMLSKVFGGSTVDWIRYASSPMWEILMIFLFRNRLIDAYAQGVFKKYTRFEHNDTRFRGAFNINEHLRENIPFRGTLAYTTHEFSYDNPITRLVRHTLRHIQVKYPDLLAGAGQTFTEARHAIEQHTPGWDPRGLHRCIKENIRPLRHPYFSAYEPLRIACLSVLRDEGASFYESDAEHEAEGVIFDGAWLWENYLATILPPAYTHADNISEANPIYLFTGNKYKRFPDFYYKNVAVIDAKYKHLQSGPIDRSDIHQLITYMYILKSVIGAFISPDREISSGIERNDAAKTVGILNGYGGSVRTIPFVVPKLALTPHADDFVREMHKSEEYVKAAARALMGGGLTTG